MSAKSPDPTDMVIGERVRGIRLQRGVTQASLAAKLGVTFQQVQKYEKGGNRISGSRLLRIAEVLGVGISDLMQGASADGQHRAQGGAPDPVLLLSQDKQGMRLARAFSAIKHKQTRAVIVQMAEVCASNERRRGEPSKPSSGRARQGNERSGAT